MSSISNLANFIYENEFEAAVGSPQPSIISGWLLNNLGTLNTYLHANFTGADPELCGEESGIFTHLYLSNYYSKQARLALRGIINDSGSVLEVRDNDHSVAFVNRNEVAKSFRGLANHHKDVLDDLVAKYNLYQSRPIQVAGIDSDQTIY